MDNQLKICTTIIDYDFSLSLQLMYFDELFVLYT